MHLNGQINLHARFWFAFHSLIICLVALLVFLSAFNMYQFLSISNFQTVGSSSFRHPKHLTKEDDFNFTNDFCWQPLSGRIIFLDAGHGGIDPGCVYPLRNPEYFEKDFNLIIALETATILEDLGATVVLTRSSDEWLSIYARAAMLHLYIMDYWDMQSINPLDKSVAKYLRIGMHDTIRVNSTNISDGCMGPMVGSGFSNEMILLLEAQYEMYDFLFLSIHINWNDDPSYRGVQVYYVTDEEIIESEIRLLENDPYYYNNSDYIVREPYYGRDGEHNATLAQIMYDEITQSVPEMETNIAPIVKANFAVLREHGIPSVMLELGFLSNETDRELLSDPEIITNISRGIAIGCLKYFDYVDFELIVE